MLYPNICVDDVTELLVKVRENVCPHCMEKHAPPELIELLDCNCRIDEGRDCIVRAKAMMTKLEAA
jgi:hypothetical protein